METQKNANKKAAQKDVHTIANDKIIEYLKKGIVPWRKNWTGLLPVPGNGAYEWAGFIPIDQLPSLPPLQRLPLHAADDRLLGGLDLSATLQAGRPVAERGLLAMTASRSSSPTVRLAALFRLTARVVRGLDRASLTPTPALPSGKAPAVRRAP